MCWGVRVGLLAVAVRSFFIYDHHQQHSMKYYMLLVVVRSEHNNLN